MKRVFYLLLIIGFAVSSCHKPEEVQNEIDVIFQTSVGGQNLKSSTEFPTFDCSTLDATKAKIKIRDNSNQNVKTYTVNLLDNGTNTASIKLKAGSYTVIEFGLYDVNGVLVLATPIATADFGQFVSDGLPYDFTIEGFHKKEIQIQVLCYTPTDIDAFGFSWFTIEMINVRELCFFGDICVDPIDYTGSKYVNQINGLQHDMTAIFNVKILKWNPNTENFDFVVTNKNNELHPDGSNWYGEGAALCVQYPDYIGEDKFRVELTVYYKIELGSETSDFDYVLVDSWEFTDNNFPVTDIAGDGVIDFVIGDCVPNSDLQYDPEDPTVVPPIDPIDDYFYDGGNETGFGFDPTNGFATCFIDDIAIHNNRWGWTNGPYTVGTHVLELWAGAGQCDTSNGIQAGTVTLTYDGSTATVNYNLFSGASVGDVQLYVGEDKYPMKNGKPTVSPGQFPYSGSTSYVISDLSGTIYIIAHADVVPAN